jgi:signal transduction histidine kinase
MPAAALRPCKSASFGRRAVRAKLHANLWRRTGGTALSQAHVSTTRPGTHAPASLRLRVSAADAAEIVLLAAAYYGLAKLGQTLRYTASVSAIWPPAGLGIAVLYWRGLRLWPGIFIGELLVNGELLLGNSALPLASVAGQQLGNLAEIIVGAWLLRRLIGPRATLDRATQVGGMIVAAGTATAISATIGTLSMLAGDVIDIAHAPTFWRTWWLGDSAGAVVVVPLILTWIRDARAAWRRLWTPEGILLLVTVVGLATLAVTSEAPLTYLIFPALIWAAFRFGPAGVTLATAINAALTIGITADSLGAFFKQPIDNRTLSTQLYVLTTALTALFLSAVVSERERSAVELVAARRREGERALEERRRIARDLHDSVSQALFSSALHTRAAEKTLDDELEHVAPKVRENLRAIGQLTKRAQSEMRRFIFDWGPDGVGDGLVSAFTRHASALAADSGIDVHVEGPNGPLALTIAKQAQLYAIGREALANVARHSGVVFAVVRVEANPRFVCVEIRDKGRGFVHAPSGPDHHGLESMLSRAKEIGGELSITSSSGNGTVVHVQVPVDAES